MGFMDVVEDKLGRTFAAIDAGDPAAVRQLFTMVYEELKANAHELMQQERTGHTLGATALVHEAYLKLVDAGCGWQSRTHFINSAALAMRRILVDHARKKGSAKRGAGWKRALIEDADNAITSIDFDWIGLDEALERFAKVDARAHQVVMLRFFAGRSEREIGNMLDISERQVGRDWKTAQLWLRREMDCA